MRDKNFQTDQTRRHWIMISGLAAFVRLLYLLVFLASPLYGYHFADHLYYRNWGLQIAGGDWFGQQAFEQGPLYAYLLAVAFRLGLSEAVVLGLQLLVGIGSSVLIYECGKRLFDAKTALLAGLLTAVYGPLVFYECMLMKSFLLPVIISGLLYCALRYQVSLRPGWLWIAGATIGVACLIRENHLFFLIPLACWTWWCGVGQQVPVLRRGIHLGVIIGALALTILPVTLRNYLVADEFVVVTAGGGEVWYLAHGPEANGYWHTVPFVKPSPWREHEDFRLEAAHRLGQKTMTRSQASRFWRQAAWDEIKRDPKKSFGLTWLKGRVFFHDLEVPDSADYVLWHEYLPMMWLLPGFGWFAGLGLLGCAICWRTLGKHQLLLGFIAVHLVSVLLTYNFGRFRIGMMPVFLLLAACGLMWLIRSFRETGRRRKIVACCGIAGVVLVSGWSFTTPPGYSLVAYQGRVRITRQGIEAQRLARGQLVEAKASLMQRPSDPRPHSRIGQAYAVLGYRPEAIEHHQQAIKLAPSNPEWYMKFSFDLKTLGLQEAAVRPLKQALQLNRNIDVAHTLLGDYYREQGDQDAAIGHYRSAVKINPEDLLASNSLSVMLVTHPDPTKRNGAEAVRLAEHVHRSLQAKGQASPQVLDTLAAAYAEGGDFEKARQTIEEAIQLAQSMGQVQFSQQLQVRRRQYERMP